LKSNIKDIGLEGLKIARILPEGQMRQLLGQAGAEITSDTTEAYLDLELTRAEAAESVVLARGSVQAVFSVTCSRCLAPARITVDEPELALTFLPPAQGVAEEEVGLEDLDTFAHDGEVIDLEPVLRELFIWAIPMAPLCSPECRGLCTVCGVDLNHETCQCPVQDNVKTPWAAALTDPKKTVGQRGPGNS
jgi:uncharacterized protein